MISDDVKMAALARRLAEALCTYARERRADHRIEVATLQSELCRAWRDELQRTLTPVTESE